MKPFSPVDDLDDLLRFTQRIWSLHSRFHVGDIAWQMGLYMLPDEPMTVWRSDGNIVALASLARGELSLIVDPALPALVDTVLSWARSAHGGTPDVVALDRETHIVDHLVAAGYRADPDVPYFLAHNRDLADLPPIPALPDGFTIRPVRGEEDIERRVELHRAVWAPSSFTIEKYRSLTSRWPYDARFDQVVVAPDGRFVAYVLGWYDDANRCGEFEPVGTLPDLRRMGLSRAVSLSVLHAFRDAGGTTALVYARGDGGYPIPRQVYASLGFRPHARTVTYRAPLSGS
jgi:GNAT superfamily N-acetyltransferase